MSKNVLGQFELSERYARALFSLASEEKKLSSVPENLKDLQRGIAENADLDRLLRSPLISTGEKLSGLRALSEKSGFDPLIGHFLCLLAETKRLPYLPGIIRAFLKLVQKSQGIETAYVAVAHPLSEKDTGNLRAALEKASGKKIELQVKVNPALIGGMTVKVGSRMMDGSLSFQLRQLKNSMKGTSAS